jgi:putative spermidine/putrescine transport system substrate-binding protein
MIQPERNRLRSSLATIALLVAVGCTSTPPPAAGPTIPPPPTAKIRPQASIGQGEGQLALISVDGYLDDSWVKPFVDQTGCAITKKLVGPSDEMVSLMKDGGGGTYDMVSASGDIGLRLIYDGNVKPMNTSLIPDWNNFNPFFKDPAFNTISGVHYGISLQWGPNSLLFNTRKFPNAPTSWNVIYDPANKGLITVPDSPMQIADAALYLSKSQPSLGIKDPYELTKKQFDAVVALLKQQKPLIREYWSIPSQEISMFQNAQVFVGAGSSYQAEQLKTAGATIAETIPTEGATGWADTWMLATKAPHPNCAYMWTKWVSTPKVQAQQAWYFGESPVNTKACAEMEGQKPGSCGAYHANADAAYLESLKFWKTPLAICPDGTSDCTPYEMWVTAWASVKS